MKYILQHWRTSLGGLLIAILLAVQPIAMNKEGFDLQKDWLQYSIAIGIATVGFIIKDPNKKEDDQGGTT